jgi:hypothetical protein
MILDFEMIENPPKNLTNGRMEKFLEIVRNAPRDPSCGCVKLGETARLLVEALFADQRAEDAAAKGTDDE